MKIKWFVLLGIILLAGFFYWFQYRPSHIRSICVDKISNNPNSADVLEIQYQMCLRSHGIEK